MHTVHGQIQTSLSSLIYKLEHDELYQEVETLLRSNFAHLGKVEARDRQHRQMGRVSLKAGRYLIKVSGTWVEINTLGRYQARDSHVVRELHQALTDLVSGLAGMALQRYVVREIMNTGHLIYQVQRAGDGSVVIELEL